MNPLVSVVVTMFNQAPYIEDALRSVLAQTYRPMEVIAVDDGSTDDTPARIAAFTGRVRYFRQRNAGVAASRNVGVREAKGELLAFLDGDDLWEPDKLAVQAEAAVRYPDAGLIAVDGVEFSDGGVIDPSLLVGPHATELLTSTHEPLVACQCYRELLWGNFICTTSQVMVPARVLTDVGLSDTRIKRASDYDLYLRIAARYNVVLVKKRLVRWRYLATSVSGPSHLRDLRWSEDVLHVLQKHLALTPESYRPFLRGLIRRKTRIAALGAYDFGRRVDKIWATRYLLRLLLRGSSSLWPLASVIALWCPARLTPLLRPVARRFLYARAA